MDDSERPNKIRKLDHDRNFDHEATHDDRAAGTTNGDVSDTEGSEQTPMVLHNDQSRRREREASPVESGPPSHSHVKANSSLAALAAANPGLSKHQLKKLRRQEQWEADRDRRRAKRKDRVVAKREKKQHVRQTLRDSGMTESEVLLATRSDRGREQSQAVPVVFLIDCGYDDLMSAGEMTSLSAQITRAYGENRKAKYRGVVGVSNFTGKLRARFDGPLRADYVGYKSFRWDERSFKDVSVETRGWLQGRDSGKLVGPFADLASANSTAESLAALRSQGQVVYLSSESEQVLETLSPFDTYIIGGLVDKNREKGLCYRRACEAGIKTARLPIGEYLDMQSRKVLATNHVVEIMLKWLEYRSWERAFLEVIPKRKGGKAKGGPDAGKDDGSPATGETDTEFRKGGVSGPDQGDRGSAELDQVPPETVETDEIAN